MGGKKQQRQQSSVNKKKEGTSKKPVKNTSKHQRSTESATTDDWISALAKQTVAEASSNGAPCSKAERIERRNAKKRRREDRNPVEQKSESKPEQQDNTDADTEGTTRYRKMNSRSQLCLEWLTGQIVASLGEKLARKKPYQCPDSGKRGKATSGSGKVDEEMIQPRTRDYGGLGFARPSMFLSLRDPSFIPKLEEEFAEHVPGFFGKQRTKAMKKQLDGNMLWRKLAEERTDNRKIDGKKISEMAPEERVEAMVRAGML